MTIRSNNKPDFSLELESLAGSGKVICGVDEAGRGPLAGPVVAAAVILDPLKIPAGLNDSKKLSENVRNALFAEILAKAEVGVGLADVAQIDKMNILHASMWAMAQAINDLPVRPDLALIDGNRKPETAVSCKTVVKGDSRSLSIAAASIIAKVTRDRIMTALDFREPVYGFARHKGYGTKFHLEMLALHGPCSHHRRSFAPVREALGKPIR
ncbi:MAG: ribonuclease HII [Anderseniella sp.]